MTFQQLSRDKKHPMNGLMPPKAERAAEWYYYAERKEAFHIKALRRRQ